MGIPGTDTGPLAPAAAKGYNTLNHFKPDKGAGSATAGGPLTAGLTRTGGYAAVDIVIIVEGKKDKARLSRVLSPDVPIHCTYGSLSSERIEKLRRAAGNRQVYLFMDNDASGRKIRAILCDVFPEAVQIYTRKGYNGVEGTPEEYLIRQLEKAGLEEYIVYPECDPAPDRPVFPGKRVFAPAVGFRAGK